MTWPKYLHQILIYNKVVRVFSDSGKNLMMDSSAGRKWYGMCAQWEKLSSLLMNPSWELIVGSWRMSVFARHRRAESISQIEGTARKTIRNLKRPCPVENSGGVQFAAGRGGGRLRVGGVQQEVSRGHQSLLWTALFARPWSKEFVLLTVGNQGLYKINYFLTLKQIILGEPNKTQLFLLTPFLIKDGFFFFF